MTHQQIDNAAKSILSAYRAVTEMTAVPSISEYIALREEALREFERGIGFDNAESPAFTGETAASMPRQNQNGNDSSGGYVTQRAASVLKKRTAPAAQQPETQKREETAINHRGRAAEKKSDFEILKSIRDEWN